MVADETISKGVALVEGVVGEWLDDIEEIGAEFLVVAGIDGALNELNPVLGDEFAVLLAACLAKVVGLFE